MEFKFILVDPAQVEIKTISSAIKGLPMRVILVHGLPFPFYVISTGVRAEEKNKHWIKNLLRHIW